VGVKGLENYTDFPEIEGRPKKKRGATGGRALGNEEALDKNPDLFAGRSRWIDKSRSTNSRLWSLEEY